MLCRTLLVGRQQSVEHYILIDSLVEPLRKLIARVVAAMHATVLQQVLDVIKSLLILNGCRAEGARAARSELVTVARLQAQHT